MFFVTTSIVCGSSDVGPELDDLRVRKISGVCPGLAKYASPSVGGLKLAHPCEHVSHLLRWLMIVVHLTMENTNSNSLVIQGRRLFNLRRLPAVGDVSTRWLGRPRRTNWGRRQKPGPSEASCEHVRGAGIAPPATTEVVGWLF